MAARTSSAAELWRQRVLAQQASGQSVRGWCRAHDCPEHGFYCWRARLGLSPVANRRRRRRIRQGASIGFARVIVEPPAAATPDQPLRLTLAGGRELMLPASMPVEQVVRIVRAIEGAA